MATSKETRVRVDGLSKIIASTLPASGFGALAALRRTRLEAAALVEDRPRSVAGVELGEVEEMADHRAPSCRPAPAVRRLERAERRVEAAAPPRRSPPR